MTKAQMIEWELDNLAEDVFKGDEPPSPSAEPDPDPVEYNLEPLQHIPE